jgi:hypothetical protein
LLGKPGAQRHVLRIAQIGRGDLFAPQILRIFDFWLDDEERAT